MIDPDIGKMWTVDCDKEECASQALPRALGSQQRSEMSARHWHTKYVAGFFSGAGIGILGGLVGLGGAEFRLPLLIGLFAFAPLEAVILNKAMSLVVVAAALPARASVVPFAQVGSHWQVIVTLLSGSLLGAWWGAGCSK